MWASPGGPHGDAAVGSPPVHCVSESLPPCFAPEPPVPDAVARARLAVSSAPSFCAAASVPQTTLPALPRFGSPVGWLLEAGPPDPPLLLSPIVPATCIQSFARSRTVSPALASRIGLPRNQARTASVLSQVTSPSTAFGPPERHFARVTHAPGLRCHQSARSVPRRRLTPRCSGLAALAAELDLV